MFIFNLLKYKIYFKYGDFYTLICTLGPFALIMVTRIWVQVRGGRVAGK